MDVLSSIIPYTFPETGTPVRVIGSVDAPLFHHGDVCKILQHSNPTVAARMLDDDESVMIDLRGIAAGQTALSEFRAPATGNAEARFLTEPGLYTLVFNSRAPGAPAFRRWITHEVLPSIRRTGGYMAPVVAAPSPRELAALVIAEADRADAAEALVAELAPKAMAHDTYLSVGSGDRLVREVAKLLGWRQQDLRQFLIAEKLIFARQAECGTTQWDFYAGLERHFRSAEHVVEHRTTGLCSHYTLHVRPAGVDLIQKRITRRQAERDAIGGAA